MSHGDSVDPSPGAQHVAIVASERSERVVADAELRAEQRRRREPPYAPYGR